MTKMDGADLREDEVLLDSKDKVHETSGFLQIDKLTSDSKVKLVNLKEVFSTICALTMGSGIILCPYVIHQLGAIPGSIAIAVIVLIQYYNACVLSISTVKCLEDNLLSHSSRYTYQILAEIVGGSKFRLLSVITLYISSLSAAISDVLLSASLLNDVVQLDMDNRNAMRLYSSVIVLLLLPISYLGTYADLKFPIMFGLCSSLISGIGIIVNCILVRTYYPHSINHIAADTDKYQSIFISLGSIFFFTSAGPCIPNTVVLCKEPEKISFPITASFLVNFIVILVIGIVPYFTFNGNVLPSTIGTFTKFLRQHPDFISFKVITHSIQLLMFLHFTVALLMNMNVVFLHIEKVLDIPYQFNKKRIICRTCFMLGVLVVCVAIPDFEVVVSLSGGIPGVIIGTLMPLYFYIHICETNLKIKIFVYGLMVLVTVLMLGNLIANIFSQIF